MVTRSALLSILALGLVSSTAFAGPIDTNFIDLGDVEIQPSQKIQGTTLANDLTDDGIQPSQEIHGTTLAIEGILAARFLTTPFSSLSPEIKGKIVRNESLQIELQKISETLEAKDNPVLADLEESLTELKQELASIEGAIVGYQEGHEKAWWGGNSYSEQTYGNLASARAAQTTTGLEIQWVQEKIEALKSAPVSPNVLTAEKRMALEARQTALIDESRNLEETIAKATSTPRFRFVRVAVGAYFAYDVLQGVYHLAVIKDGNFQSLSVDAVVAALKVANRLNSH